MSQEGVQFIVCVQCHDCTRPSSANEIVSVSPGPRQLLQLGSDDDGIERQSSFDKSKKKLKGAAKKSKISKIMKERAQVNDNDELIATDELKSSSEGVYIKDRILRCNKARILKKKIQKAVLELNRCCGYSADIHIQAPLPITGPRAAGLVLDLPDLNGEKALGSKIDLKKHVRMTDVAQDSDRHAHSGSLQNPLRPNETIYQKNLFLAQWNQNTVVDELD